MQMSEYEGYKYCIQIQKSYPQTCDNGYPFLERFSDNEKFVAEIENFLGACF